MTDASSAELAWPAVVSIRGRTGADTARRQPAAVLPGAGVGTPPIPAPRQDVRP